MYVFDVWSKCYHFFPHPLGDYILSASRDGTVRIWDISTGQCPKTLYHPQVGCSIMPFEFWYFSTDNLKRWRNVDLLTINSSIYLVFPFWENYYVDPRNCLDPRVGYYVSCPGTGNYIKWFNIDVVNWVANINPCRSQQIALWLWPLLEATIMQGSGKDLLVLSLLSQSFLLVRVALLYLMFIY